jgi:hypothetical protein
MSFISKSFISKFMSVAAVAILVLFMSGCGDSATNVENKPESTPPLQMIYPNGGEVLKIASEVTLVAQCDTGFVGSAVFFKLSLDTGRTWSYELDGATLKFPANRKIEYPYTIPDSIEIGQKKMSTKSTQCLMMIGLYEPQSIKSVSKAVFTIQ